MRKGFDRLDPLPAGYVYAGRNLWLKRLLDRALAVALLVGAGPFLALLVVGFYIEGLIDPRARGALWVRDIRISRGSAFVMLKFRTTYDTCDEARRVKVGASNAIDDRDVTRFGAWVRRFYLDELAQLLNILSGEMSFVGPRPVPRAMYGRVLRRGYQNKRLLVAGLCGPVQALKGHWREYGSYLDADEWLVRAYESRSAMGVVWLDIGIMWWTLLKVFDGDGLESPHR